MDIRTAAAEQVSRFTFTFPSERHADEDDERVPDFTTVIVQVIITMVDDIAVSQLTT